MKIIKYDDSKEEGPECEECGDLIDEHTAEAMDPDRPLCARCEYLNYK